MKPAIFFSLLILNISTMGVARADEGGVSSVPFSANLQHDGRLAMVRKVPLLLMFSADDCPYCRVMESDHLVPLLRNREYDELVLIRKVHLDSSEKLINFSGSAVTPTMLRNSYDVWLTPTLLFLDDKGREIERRVIGLGVRDFVNGEIDELIMAAIGGLRG